MKGIKSFTPNYKTHKEFGDALKKANDAGVKILAYDCIVEANTLKIDKPITVDLSGYIK